MSEDISFVKWKIVQFKKDDSVCAVPSIWIEEEKDEENGDRVALCAWPDKKMSTEILNYIQKCKKPKETWSKFPVVVWCSAATIEEARIKEVLSKDHSGSEIEGEYLKYLDHMNNKAMRHQRRKRRSSTPPSLSSEASSDSSDNELEEKDAEATTLIPPPPANSVYNSGKPIELANDNKKVESDAESNDHNEKTESNAESNEDKNAENNAESNESIETEQYQMDPSTAQGSQGDIDDKNNEGHVALENGKSQTSERKKPAIISSAKVSFDLKQMGNGDKYTKSSCKILDKSALKNKKDQVPTGSSSSEFLNPYNASLLSPQYDQNSGKKSEGSSDLKFTDPLHEIPLSPKYDNQSGKDKTNFKSKLEQFKYQSSSIKNCSHVSPVLRQVLSVGDQELAELNQGEMNMVVFASLKEFNRNQLQMFDEFKKNKKSNDSEDQFCNLKELLPLKTLREIKDFDEELRNRDCSKRLSDFLTVRHSKISGKKCVHDLIDEVLSKKLQCNFNMRGRGTQNKYAFDTLKVWAIIKDIVMEHHTDILDIDKEAGEWLKGAPKCVKREEEKANKRRRTLENMELADEDDSRSNTED